MAVAGPSLVLPALASIFSSSSPPTTHFPQTIALFHTVREWLPVVLQEAEIKIIQWAKELETRKAKGKGKAREQNEGEGVEEVELVELNKTRALLAKGKKLEGKGLNFELILKAAHIRSILFTTPIYLSSIPSLIDTYFPRPPPPNQASSTSSASTSADDLKTLASQRKIIQNVFSVVKDFVKSYDGDVADLPSALAASFSSSDAARGNSFPWEQLSGWIRSWLIKVEGVWNELEDGVGGETGDASTTTTMNQDLLSPRNPSPSKQPFAPVKSQSKPLSTSAAVLPPPPPSKASPSPTSTGPAKRPSTTATALIPPPRKKARKSKLGGRTTRNMFGEDSSEEDSEEE